MAIISYAFIKADFKYLSLRVNFMVDLESPFQKIFTRFVNFLPSQMNFVRKVIIQASYSINLASCCWARKYSRIILLHFQKYSSQMFYYLCSLIQVVINFNFADQIRSYCSTKMVTNSTLECCNQFFTVFGFNSANSFQDQEYFQKQFFKIKIVLN